jgi:hypothetical protein
VSQPAPTATAGAAFAPQPQIRIEDQFGNLRTSDNSTVVSAARNLGSGTLQGTTAATVSGGVATFANLNYTVAENDETLVLAVGVWWERLPRTSWLAQRQPAS